MAPKWTSFRASCASGSARGQSVYDPLVLNNASRGRKFVCVECMTHGLSPKDVNMYKCDECGDRGHRKFVPEQLRQHKNSQGRKKMVCTDCTARHKQIEKVLRLPKAWKCKCPGKGHERQHIPDNVKCDLVPVQMGEKRWPGKNMGVTEADLDLVTRMRKRHKP